ncbi:serine/threonine-protein kinase ULK3-like [Uloborus diversus]|uniref:serine/threonine-protein kinase ULK3-like n=1 Tax=Uloborus diversus TaxID=327109 RepID=UPI0024098D99|nr:serine/threonine-protein kinase ULK3-like [Uloborus diversus]XP_054720220.1 serine/threonine-protein kinase ULK3-like [Uloborus diversus]
MSIIPTLPDYIFTERLGKGSYATVYKAYQKGNTRDVVAVKCVQKSSLTKSSVENLLTEISILKKIKHNHIVELKDFQWDDKCIYLILEYCSGGDLSHFIRSKKRLPEPLVQRFLQQLAKALQFLRSQNIAHMDLKPQNILLSSVSNPVLKLGDFGLAQYLNPDSEATSMRGSPLYMAPEILLKHLYDARVDLWSVGIILYECLFGEAPFSSSTFAELAEKIKSSNPIQLPYGAQVSEKCKDLILKLLQRDPNKRITFDEFFNHPFVDLEHMPTEETYSKGVELIHKAVKSDVDGEYESAINFYSQALDYLVPHLFHEKDRSRRKEMRKKFIEYVSRAEELKKLSKMKIQSQKNDNTESISNSNPSFEELLQSKPELKKGIYLAAQADALVSSECYDDASEVYKVALELMISAVSGEPAGPRKDLLYTEVDKWMQKAEDLKSYISIRKQEKRLARLSSISETVSYDKSKEQIESTCLIQ